MTRVELLRELTERDAEQQRGQAAVEELRGQKAGLETRLAELGAEAEWSVLAAAALADERAAIQRELAETRGQLGRESDQLSGEEACGETLRSESWYASLQRRLTTQDAAELSETVAQEVRRSAPSADWRPRGARRPDWSRWRATPTTWRLPSRRRPAS